MLSKLFYKLFNPQKYKDLKKEKQIRETVKIFEKKYKSYFDLLDEKIKKIKEFLFYILVIVET